MEALLVKLGVLAGLFGYIGLLGLALLLASVIWLIIRVANFDSVLPGLLCVLASIALVAGGLLLTPAPKSVEMEPLRPPWEAPLEALKEQAGKLREQVGKLKDIGPWARFFKDEEPPEDAPEEGGAKEPEGEEQPEMERMEVIRTSPPEPEDAPMEETGSRSPTGRNQPGKGPAENGGAEPAAPEQSRILLDEVLDGWRIRLTLPREWKDACVVKNNGYGWLNFSQKVSLQEEGGWGGWLFSLSVVESPYDFEAPDALPACEAVLEKDGMTLLAIYPTDVQFNYEIEKIAEEYQRMQAEIPSILETAEFERA